MNVVYTAASQVELMEEFLDQCTVTCFLLNSWITWSSPSPGHTFPFKATAVWNIKSGK